jgi:hypothetical protein
MKRHFALMVLTAIPACQAGTEPVPAPTLSVVNATCAVGPCARLDIRGFVPKYGVPGQAALGGFLPIGNVASAHACLMFPASDTLAIIGPADTTVVRWTPVDEVLVMVFEAGSVPHRRGQSQEFVPGDSPGWQLIYPDATGTAVIERAEPCSG